MIDVKIVNVVATASTCKEFQFKELTNDKQISYNPDNYAGRVAYFKSSAMDGKIAIFSSGKMISVGTKNEKQASHELKLASDFIIQNGYSKSSMLDFKVQNIVVLADFKVNLDLENLVEKTKAIYEPEQFPAAVVRFVEPYKVCILIFASGKTIVSGIKSEKEIEPTIEKLTRLLQSE